MMRWLKGIFFKPLPDIGDKVGFSRAVLKEHKLKQKCFQVVIVIGDEDYHVIHLHCGTVLYKGQWKILDKDTPILT